MKSQKSSSKRFLKKPTLEYAKYTITYMRKSPGLLNGLMAVFVGLGLFVFSLIKIDQEAGLMILLTGIIAAIVARWKLQTNFGLYLAGPAIACIIGGTTLWVFKDTSWLWIPAILALGWALWKIILFSKAQTAYKDSLRKTGQYLECQISFFRPFDSRYAEWARNIVIPLLMSYGCVEHVGDDFFKESPTRGVLSGAYKQQTEDVLSKMDEYDEATRKMIEMTKTAIGSDLLHGTDFDDSKWKDGVLDILEGTDIAVVDVSTVSDNVLWELKNCLRYLSPSRVILIASLDAVKKIEQHKIALLTAIFESGISGIQNVLVYHPNIVFRFAKDLHERMIIIAGNNQVV